jgi:hypothetical protein
LFASTDVLQKFNEFARRFSLVAADRKVTGKERAELMDVLGQLSTTIRHDLASQEDRRLEKRRFSCAWTRGPKASATTCAVCCLA